MDKEDVKVLIHAGLALVVIFGGFTLIELYGKPMITGGAIGPQESKEIHCVEVNNVEHRGIKDRGSCCKMIVEADECKLLDGTMEVGYDYDAGSGELEGVYKAEYVCISDRNKIYFSFDTYEYCELSGYRIILY